MVLVTLLCRHVCNIVWCHVWNIISQCELLGHLLMLLLRLINFDRALLTLFFIVVCTPLLGCCAVIVGVPFQIGNTFL